MCVDDCPEETIDFSTHPERFDETICTNGIAPRNETELKERIEKTECARFALKSRKGE